MKPPRSVLSRLLAELESAGVRLDLEGMRSQLRRLGDPQLRLPHVLVGGTNGKGSTAALLTSILVAAGYRTGLYTSPHLESVRERLRIDGRALRVGVLERWLRAAVEGAEPTYFEALTLAAFHGFAREVEIAIFEVGLGGRLDATNAGSPILSIVTEVGLDHGEFLGDRLEQIALEKAGIFRPGVPAVIGAREPVARATLVAEAERVGAEVIDVASTARWSGREPASRLVTQQGSYELRSRLRGAHQRANAAIAVVAAERLARLGWDRVTTAAVEAGVGRARWPGRLESVELPDGATVLLDAAHNAQSADVLAAELAEHPPFTLLFGVLSDKDVDRILRPLAAMAEAVVVTTPPSPRARPAAEVASMVPEPGALVVDAPGRALEVALGFGRPVVVCGSIYLVGAVRTLLRRRFGLPPRAAEIDLTGRQPA